MPVATSSNTAVAPPPIDDRYRQLAPPAANANQAADDWANFGRPPGSNVNSAQQPVSQPPASFAAQNQPFDPRQPNNQATIGTQPLDTQSMRESVAGEEVPWKPLLAVSLALAGSVGANFFLGMSYADARRRYRSLVAKTTYAFQKEAGIAA